MAQEPIMSVSGIRGTAGGTLTEKLYSAVAFVQTRLCGCGRMLVGRDTRPSGAAFARAAFRGIKAAGGEAVDIGIAPTPTVCFAVRHFAASGGIIITASHNPVPYNGYKMVHRSGRLATGRECEDVYARYRAGEYMPIDRVRAIDDSPDDVLDASNAHVEKILEAVDAGTIRAARMRIAIDSVNGAGAAIFPRLLGRLQVDWDGVHTDLSGDFPHNPEPRPEHLSDLSSLLGSRDDYWGGFAFDPDADRLAPLGEHGEAVSEEMTLALALNCVLARERSPVAVNLSTSMVIDDVAAKYGVEVIRTRIGEAHVVEAMLENNCIVGGEGNGGVIFPRVSTVRDGFTALALILELMAKRGRKINALVDEWKFYPIVKERITCEGADGAALVDALISKFSGERIDTRDGLKIVRDYGWVHVRPSNTEPIIRCYAEARTRNQARELAAMVMDSIGKR